MRNSLRVRILILLALTAGIFAHSAVAQDIFSAGSDTATSDTDQNSDAGDVFSAGTSDESDEPYIPPSVGDVFSGMTTDDVSDQGGGTPDRMPMNPFFGMEFRLLADAAELEEEKPQSGLPLPTDVRSQLLQTAARLDNASTNAQNYSLTSTNRFFHCMTEAVTADLQFLAQPGYVPAAQIAKTLHPGVWTYLTSNAYDNNLKMYDAAVQSMRHTMNDPACVFGQAAPALLSVAATRTVGAMAEARQVSKAANAAIALEEESEANGFSNAPWYVPDLRCEGCLVYGTATGGYANFAEAVGGRTINAITKPVNLNWDQFSAQVLDSALQTKTPVLFSLQGMEDIDRVLAGQLRTMDTTSHELRYIQRNWPQYQSIVRFYNNGAQVPPPWQ
jgi:hypothetical protein